MTDITDRLRAHVDPAWGSARNAMHEAADEIDRLRAALRACAQELEAVLRSINTDSVHFDGDEFHERLQAARAALGEKP